MASSCPLPLLSSSPPSRLYLTCCHIRTREQARAPERMGSAALGRCLACPLPTPASPELKGQQRGAVRREKKVALALQTLETHEAKLIVSPEISCWRKGRRSETPACCGGQVARRGSFLGPPPHAHFIVSLPYKSNTALCQNIHTLEEI